MASADMATKFGMSLDEAGNSLAKAINAPELMRRLAMQLKIDPATVEHIQDLAKAGHEAQARMELLAIAESKVGGAAKAAFDADPIAQFKKNMQESNEAVGMLALDLLKSLSPALNDIGKAFRSTIEFLREHETEIKAVAVGIAAYTTAVLLAEAPTLALTAAQWALNLAMSANPISLLVVGFSALVAGIYYAYEKSEWFRNELNILGDDALIAANAIRAGWQMLKGDAEGYEATLTRIHELENDRYKRVHGISDLGVEGKPSSNEFNILSKRGGVSAAKEVVSELSPKGATGTKAITINISINKMIETFKISTTNLQESASKAHEAVGNALLQAVNDANITANI
jgi:hypothetical protein